MPYIKVQSAVPFITSLFVVGKVAFADESHEQMFADALDCIRNIKTRQPTKAFADSLAEVFFAMRDQSDLFLSHYETALNQIGLSKKQKDNLISRFKLMSATIQEVKGAYYLDEIELEYDSSEISIIYKIEKREPTQATALAATAPAA